MFKKTLLASVLTLALASCQSTNTNNVNVSTDMAFASLNKDIKTYEQMVDNASEDSLFNANLLLARAQIVSQNFPNAKEILTSLKSTAITPLQKDEIKIIESLMYFYDNDIYQANTLMSQVDTLTLPKSVAIYYYQLLSNIKEKQFTLNQNKSDILQAFNAKKELLKLVDDNSAQKVNKDIINVLKNIKPNELAIYVKNTLDQNDKGYFEYALIDSSANNNLRNKLGEKWLENYPDHPLYSYVKSTVNNTQNQDTTLDGQKYFDISYSLKDGDNVAVILPLTGRFADNIGNIAKLGILAAIKDSKIKINAVFYDSNVQNIADISKQLKANNTKFVLGLILKPEVDAFNQANLNLPSVVFNTSAYKGKNQYYFNLSPNYEGAIAANKMYQDHLKNVMVIANNSSNSQRAVEGFENAWSIATQTTANTCIFNNLTDAYKDVKKCNFTNIDGVYVYASSLEVSTIAPAIGNIPMYLTNKSNVGVNDTGIDLTLSNATLGDYPWLLTDSDLKNVFMKNIPKADPTAQRVFAVAYDSVFVALNLDKLKNNPDQSIYGLSGSLQISNNGQISNIPTWIKLGNKVIPYSN